MTYTKRNDTWGEVTYRAILRSGEVVDLTGATVQFKMEAQSGELLVNSPAIITDAINGIMEYKFVAGDTILAGKHKAEFTVKFSDNITEKTFPEDGFIEVVVTKDIDTGRTTEVEERTAIQVSLIQEFKDQISADNEAFKANVTAEISGLEQLKTDTNIAKDDAILATTNATTQANYAKTQGDYAKSEGDKVANKITEANIVITNANTATTNANNAATNANNKATLAQTATTNANTATDNAIIATTNAVDATNNATNQALLAQQKADEAGIHGQFAKEQGELTQLKLNELDGLSVVQYNDRLIEVEEKTNSLQDAYNNESFYSFFDNDIIIEHDLTYPLSFVVSNNTFGHSGFGVFTSDEYEVRSRCEYVNASKIRVLTEEIYSGTPIITKVTNNEYRITFTNEDTVLKIFLK